MRAVLLALLAAVSGCQSLECAEGTFEDGDKCVGYDPNDKIAPITTLSPAGGRSREPIPDLVAMTTNEPAHIYYTVDGTEPDPATQTGETSPVAVTGVAQGMTLKYFAVDRAGNREATVTTTFDSDTTAPGAITNMTLNLSGSTATVSWTNPSDADFAGVVIARVADAIDADPTPGMIYTPPAALSPSVQVATVGKMTSFTDPSRPAGPVRYVAWAFDDLGNYGAPLSVRGELPLGAMAAQYTFNTTNMQLTRTLAPDNLDLANTSATLAGTTLTMTLAVKNNTAKYFQNLKAEVTSVTNAVFGSSDGTADTFPFESFGPEAVAPGATVMRTLVFNNVVAGSTVTINLTFAHHASLLATAGRLQNQHIIDLGSGLPTPALVTTSRGPNDRFNGRTRPPMLVGGRYLDIPTTHGTIERWDLVTRKLVTAVKLSEDSERINIQGLYATPTTTFAVIKYGGRRRIAGAELVRLDETLRITGRVPLASDDRGFARAAFSADYSQLAIPLQGAIAIVDTRTLEQVDATPSSPGTIDMFEPGFIERIRSVQFFDGTNGLVVMARTGGKAAFIRRTADDYTVTPYQDAAGNVKGMSLAVAPDGKIWMAFASALRIFDPATGNVSNVTYGSPINGLANVDGKLYVIRETRVAIDQISTTGAVQATITLPANTGAHGHWLELAR